MANRRRSIPSISGGFEGLAQTERGEFARMKPWKLSFVAFGNEASTFRAGGF
jgi:hypothetical protein